MQLRWSWESTSVRWPNEHGVTCRSFPITVNQDDEISFYLWTNHIWCQWRLTHIDMSLWGWLPGWYWMQFGWGEEKAQKRPPSHPGSVHQGRVHAGWGLAVVGGPLYCWWPVLERATGPYVTTNSKQSRCDIRHVQKQSVASRISSIHPAQPYRSTRRRLMLLPSMIFCSNTSDATTCRTHMFQVITKGNTDIGTDEERQRNSYRITPSPLHSYMLQLNDIVGSRSVIWSEP